MSNIEVIEVKPGMSPLERALVLAVRDGKPRVAVNGLRCVLKCGQIVHETITEEGDLYHEFDKAAELFGKMADQLTNNNPDSETKGMKILYRFIVALEQAMMEADERKEDGLDEWLGRANKEVDRFVEYLDELDERNAEHEVDLLEGERNGSSNADFIGIKITETDEAFDIEIETGGDVLNGLEKIGMDKEDDFLATLVGSIIAGEATPFDAACLMTMRALGRLPKIAAVNYDKGMELLGNLRTATETFPPSGHVQEAADNIRRAIDSTERMIVAANDGNEDEADFYLLESMADLTRTMAAMKRARNKRREEEKAKE